MIALALCAVSSAGPLLRQADGRFVLDLPEQLIGRDMLWTIQLEGPETSNGYTIRGLQNLWIRFERSGTGIRLMGNLLAGRRADATFSKTADFPVLGSDGRTIEVDISDAIQGRIPVLSAAWTVGSPGYDPASVSPTKFYSLPDRCGATVGVLFQKGSREAMRGEVTHFIAELPPEALPPRPADARFNLAPVTVGAQKSIVRYRMKRGRTRIFYMSNEVPRKWRPFVKRAIEAWNGPLAHAGFPHAFRCEDAPSTDPNWSPADPFQDVVRWSDGSTENATGYPMLDPRSGEVLGGKIVVGDNLAHLFGGLYFAQCAAGDPRASVWPLPDSLVGQLFEYTIQHEMGHVLGFGHNCLASSAYTSAQLRNRQFTRKHGDVASVMSYGRFNYVAQPGDGAALLPKIGPADWRAVDYAYGATLPGTRDFALHPELRSDEKDQSDVNPPDPDVQWEKIGKDTLESTRLGLLNVDRANEILAQKSKSLDEETRGALHDALIQQRAHLLGHVVALVGGVRDFHALYRSPQPVSAIEQRQALDFLRTHWLATETGVEDAETVEKVSEALFLALLDGNRLRRLEKGSPLSLTDFTRWLVESVAEGARPSYRKRLIRSTLLSTLGDQIGSEDTSEPARAILKGIKQQLDATPR